MVAVSETSLVLSADVSIPSVDDEVVHSITRRGTPVVLVARTPVRGPISRSSASPVPSPATTLSELPLR